MLAIILCQFSCASSPPLVPASGWFALVPENAPVLFFAKEPFGINLFFEAVSKRLAHGISQFAGIANSTDAAILYLSDEGSLDRGWTIILIGRYSGFGLDMSLACSGSWEKIEGAIPQRGLGSYPVWKHKSLKLELVNPEGYLIALTETGSGKILRRFGERKAVPRSLEKAARAFESADSGICIRSPGEAGLFGSIPFNKEKVPISEILVKTERKGSGNELTAGFYFEAEPRIRAFSASLRTFVVWLFRKSGITGFTGRISIAELEREVSLGFAECTDSELASIVDNLLKSDQR